MEKDIIITGSNDKSIQLLSHEGNKTEKLGEKKVNSVRCLAILPNGRFASGSWDHYISIWDINTSECIGKLEGHKDSISCLAVLDDGRLISGSHDTLIKVWDPTPKNGRCLFSLKGHTKNVSCLSPISSTFMTSHDSSCLLLSGSTDCTIRLWDIDSRLCIGIFRGHGGTVRCLTVWPHLRSQCNEKKRNDESKWKDARFASGSFDHSIIVWALDMSSQPSISPQNSPMISPMNSPSLELSVFPSLPSPSSRLSSSSSSSSSTSPLQLGYLATLYGHQDDVTSLEVLPSTGQLLSASSDRTVRLWDVGSYFCVQIFEFSDFKFGGVLSLALLNDGRMVSGGYDGTIFVWDVSTENDLQNRRNIEIEKQKEMDTKNTSSERKRIEFENNDNKIERKDTSEEKEEEEEKKILTSIIKSDGKLKKGGIPVKELDENEERTNSDLHQHTTIQENTGNDIPLVRHVDTKEFKVQERKESKYDLSSNYRESKYVPNRIVESNHIRRFDSSVITIAKHRDYVYCLVSIPASSFQRLSSLRYRSRPCAGLIPVLYYVGYHLMYALNHMVECCYCCCCCCVNDETDITNQYTRLNAPNFAQRWFQRFEIPTIEASPDQNRAQVKSPPSRNSGSGSASPSPSSSWSIDEKSDGNEGFNLFDSIWVVGSVVWWILSTFVPFDRIGNQIANWLNIIDENENVNENSARRAYNLQTSTFEERTDRDWWKNNWNNCILLICVLFVAYLLKWIVT